MKNLISKLKCEIINGNACYLVALIESEGSTPRSSGAYMLVNKNGWVAGTVGGGGMEYAAVQEAQKQLLAYAEEEAKAKQTNEHANLVNDGMGVQAATSVTSAQRSFHKRFDLTPAAGMACGGYCSLEFCYMPANQASLSLADEILSKLNGDTPWWLLLPLGAGNISVQDSLPVMKHQCFYKLDGQEYFAQEYNYDGSVFIFGAGQVARELVPLLTHLGFRCLVYDDRAEFADAAVFPTAFRVQQVDYTKLGEVCSPTCKDYAVVMTRGHVYDANCERFLLKTPVSYIGIMGSKNKARLAREALLAEGYSEAELARITTPIGIDIGSETPAEIAVSIAAQLIQIRSNKL